LNYNINTKLLPLNSQNKCDQKNFKAWAHEKIYLLKDTDFLNEYMYFKKLIYNIMFFFLKLLNQYIFFILTI